MTRNVLLVILDTARARSCYPENTETTPTIHRLANSGTHFTNAISPYPWSLASHASMYTGKYATEHGATTENRYLSTEESVLAERIRSEGITTGVFTGNLFLSDTFGMERGFDHSDFMKGRGGKYFSDGFDPLAFHMREGEFADSKDLYMKIVKEILDGNALKNLINGLYFKFFYEQAEDDIQTAKSYDRRAVKSAKEFIQQQADLDNRFFSVVNLLGAHGPWPYEPEKLRSIGIEPSDIATEEEWEKVAEHSADQWQYAAGDITFDEKEQRILQLLYESWIREADGLTNKLIECLNESGIRNDTLVIVTSDHGEMICEKGVLGHNVVLDKSVTRVPLVIDGPTVEHSEVNSPVSLKNIYGTILSRMEITSEYPTLTEGEDYVISETHGADPERVSRLDEDYPENANVQQFLQKRRALFTKSGWIEKQYKDKKTRGDTDLLLELEQVVSQLSRRATSDTEPQVNSETKERLRNLGYAE